MPIPPGNPGVFVQVLCPGGGAFVHPRGTPGNLIHVVSNHQKSSCVFYSFAMEAFVGTDIDFESHWLVHEGLDNLSKIFRGEFCNFRKFSSAL